MKLQQHNNQSSNSQYIILQNDQWLHNQRIAGKIAAETISFLQDCVRDNTFHSMQALNDIAERKIIDAGGIPTFKGYKQFPAGVCISVNKTLVHGIPDDTVLDHGDVVSFDLGVTYNGAVADTATTLIFGQPKSNQHTQLIQATEEALLKAIQSIKIGAPIGVIGEVIYQCGRQYNLSIITKYGGHGLSMTADKIGIPHASPFISNKSNPNEGVRIQAGLTIAIEPLFVLGSSNHTRVLDDGWSVVCDNICSHHEHSLFVHSDRVEVITKREDERIPRDIYFNN